MVVAELATIPYVDGTMLFVVRNCGQTVARDVVVKFAPDLPDPDPAGVHQSTVPYLKKRYEKPIPVLAPGVVLSNIWQDYQDLVKPTDHTLPSQLDVTISSVAPDGHRYQEVFRLDAEVVLNETYVTSSNQPQQIAKESLKVEKQVASSLEKLVRVADRTRRDAPAPPTRTQRLLRRSTR
ncbi:hypothetical protein ACE2AJ_20715 [Aquihabitans daechungensis]|uniref:hypothetical protein n=1 Tax=Aquihabitans daechungensis TaxID=1052257 RepID=UPI003BA322DB